MVPTQPVPSSPEQPPGESAAAEPTAAVAAPTPSRPQAEPLARPLGQAQPQARLMAKSLRPAEHATQQRAIAALFLGMLSLFGVLGLNNLQRGVYVIGLAVLVGVIAIWLSVTAMSRAQRSGTMRPRGSVTAMVIGAVGVVFSGLLLTGFAVFGKQVTTYSQCLSGANTLVAQQDCQDQFVRSIEG